MTNHIPLFSLGRLVMTRGIKSLIGTQEYLLSPFLNKHSKGEWGNICEEDKEANNDALLHGGSLLSSYTYENTEIWIITEYDRSVTTVLLPDEY